MWEVGSFEVFIRDVSGIISVGRYVIEKWVDYRFIFLIEFINFMFY